MKVKITNSVIIEGAVVPADTELDLTAEIADNLIRIGCAEKMLPSIEKTGDDIEIQASSDMPVDSFISEDFQEKPTRKRTRKTSKKK